jgi:hypothetical protein
MTEPPALAAKTDHSVQTTRTAVNANETSRQNSTIDEGAEFGLHKVRNGPITLALPGEKTFQMSGDHFV